MAAGDNEGITPARLRNGVPEALAGLCEARGAAVLAYCRHFAGPDDEVILAAAAFARFRIVILPPGSLTGGAQAEALLRRVTRRAAISHAVTAANGNEQPGIPAGCRRRQVQLLGYIENTLTQSGRDEVDAHTSHCRACAAALRRLTEAEDAFRLRPGTPLPRPVAREILTALAAAAPVTAHGGDSGAVRDEALLLLTGDDEGSTMTPDGWTDAAEDLMPAPAPSAVEQRGPPEPPPPSPAVDPEPPPPSPAVAPEVAQPPPPVRRPAPVGQQRDTLDRSPGRPGRIARARLRLQESPGLLRGAAQLVGLVVVAGVVGTVIGIGGAELTGEPSAPSDAAGDPAVATPQATTPAPATGERVPIVVLSTIARPPANGGAGATRLSVRLRVRNASGRAVRSDPPQLLVDDVRVSSDAGADATADAGRLLAPSLAAGAGAEGTLRFDLRSTTPRELASARVRLQILQKVVVLTPVIEVAPAAG